MPFQTTSTGYRYWVPDGFAMAPDPMSPMEPVDMPDVAVAHERMPLAPAPPPQTVDEMLALKQGEYERFGASPEQIGQWQDYNRQRYERFVAQPDSGVAHIAQPTGPTGTIGQIGQPQAPPLGDVSTLSADLAEATQPPPEPPPEPVPLTPIAAAPSTFEGSEQVMRESFAQGDQAQQTATAADVAGAKAKADALGESLKRQQEIQADQDRVRAERAKREQDLGVEYDKTTDEWASYKVDPGRHWNNMSTARKIGTAIAIAMTALGDALQRKSGPNAAIDMLHQAIKDDVQLQMDERANLKDVAGAKRSSIDSYIKQTGRAEDAFALKMGEEMKRTATILEHRATLSSVPAIKARGMAAAAEARQMAAQYLGSVAQGRAARDQAAKEFAAQQRHQRVQEAQGWKGLSLREQEMAEQRAQREASQKAKVDEYLAKASAEEQKLVRENGIRDPVTRQYIMGDDGRPIMERNATEGGKTQDLLASSQTVLSSIDDIKAKIVGDPGFAKLNPTQKQAAVSASLSALSMQLKEAYTLGALDKGSVEFLDRMTGGDPTKITAGGLFGAIGIGADAGDKTSAKLDEIAKSVERKALNRLGNPKGYKFTRVKPQKPSPANKAAESVQRSGATTASVAQGEQPGWLSKGLQDAESLVFGTEQKYKKGQRAAQESGNSTKYVGFRADKDKDLDALVTAAKGGDLQAQSRVVEMAGNQNVAGLSDATMTLIESDLPSLLPQALAALPEDKRSYRQAIYAATSRGPRIDVREGAGVAPPPVAPRGSMLSPEQEADIARLPAQYRAAVRTALEQQAMRGY